MDDMLEVAIIGGGVCGLALAHSLQARKVRWALFEARDRLGGRVLTESGAQGQALDLGPTWFWPDHQPSLTRLIADLGLPTLAQADDGKVLLLSDPNQPAETVEIGEATHHPSDPTMVPAPEGAQTLHGGAQRLVGGMGALVQALAAPLPAEHIHQGMVLRSLEARAATRPFVNLGFIDAHGAPHTVRVRHVVLALPPRLAAELKYTPALSADFFQALRAAPTWMASAAKAAFAFERPFWRDRGHTGNAWVTHPQAVLAEVFDATGPQGAALAGFAALDAQQRETFRAGLSLLLHSQLGMLFGEAAQSGDLHWQDWAREPFTCSELDLAHDGQAEPPLNEGQLAQLQTPHWGGMLLLGGAESARHGNGYLEGALGAASRLRRDLQALLSDHRPDPGTPPGTASAPGGASAEWDPVVIAGSTAAANDARVDASRNAASLQVFGAWVAQERSQALQRYRARLHQALSRQEDAQLTQRSVVEALESLYADALQQLEELPLRPMGQVAHGRAPLTPQVLAPFQGLADELLSEAVKFNNTSCALSNFPFEHKPSRDYLATIRRDLAAVWQAFALAANERLLHKQEALP